MPLSLPSKLIEQRPDVLAAEAQVHSASAQVGVAVANRLPQFTINGALGGNATQFSQMFQSSGIFWSLIGDVSQRSSTAARCVIARAPREQALVQAAAQYRSTVLTAFQNVADTLHALYSDADALRAAVAAEQAARASLELTQKQLQSGLHRRFAAAQRAAGLSAGRAHEGAGASATAGRYGSTIPGARRRVVESGVKR